jgi:hypothetical protein
MSPMSLTMLLITFASVGGSKVSIIAAQLRVL